MKNKGLYIHIPFCDEICPYCAFSHVLTDVNKQDAYIDRVIADINKYEATNFSSVYIGGGTPSSLKENQLERLLKALEVFTKNKSVSFTIEANPDSLSFEKIKLLREYGVNRVSLGVQTFQKELQNKLKRFSSYGEIEKIIKQIKKVGINDINVDLMYGIPDETMELLKKDLELFTSLDITHISCYCLQVEEHTIFFNSGIEEMEEDNAALQYEFICDFLRERKFYHYEVSNFAKKGFESKHNLIYWHNEEYVGLGISSAGFENNIRYVNENSLTRYINYTDKRKEEILSKEEDEKYYIILNLRLKDGIILSDYQKKYRKDFLITYKNQIEKLKKYDYLKISENNVSVKEKYFFILNQVLIEFL